MHAPRLGKNPRAENAKMDPQSNSKCLAARLDFHFEDFWGR
jgi:hypothetical protein